MTKEMLLAFAISIASIVIIFQYTGISYNLRSLQQVDPKFMLLALVLHISSWIFWAVRIKFFSSMLSYNLKFGLALRATLASNFLGAITPSSAGGEPLRIKMLSDGGMNYGMATAVILAERLFDGVFFVIALAIFLIFSDFSIGFGLKVGGPFLVIMILFLAFIREILIKPERIESMIIWLKKRFGENNRFVRLIEKEVWMFREAGLTLAKGARTRIPMMIVTTTLIWMSEFLVPSAILLALGQSPSLLSSITSQLIIVMITLAPLTPGGSGVAELSMSYLYSLFVPHSIIGALVGLWRLTTYFLNIIVGAPFAGASLSFRRRKEQHGDLSGGSGLVDMEG